MDTPQPWDADLSEEERFLIACACGFHYGNAGWPKPPRSMVGQPILVPFVRSLIEKLRAHAGVADDEAADLLAPIVSGVDAATVWGIIYSLVQRIEAKP